MSRRAGRGAGCPSARVGRNRRCAVLYTPAGLIGAALVFAAGPVLNGLYLVGALLVLTAAGGFVLESGPIPPARAGRIR